MTNKVAIILGSENDKKYVEDSYKYFDYFSIEVETHVISAHRNPDQVAEFAKNARANALQFRLLECVRVGVMRFKQRIGATGFFTSKALCHEI